MLEAVLSIAVVVMGGIGIFLIIREPRQQKRETKEAYSRVQRAFDTSVDILDAIRISEQIHWDTDAEGNPVIFGTLFHDDGIPGLWMVAEEHITSVAGSEGAINEQSKRYARKMAERMGWTPLEFLQHMETLFEDFDARNLEPLFYKPEDDE